MRKTVILILSIFCFTGYSQTQEVFLIPKPQQMEIRDGNFSFDKNTGFFFDSEFEIAGNFLQDFLQNGAGFQLPKKSKEKAQILIEKDANQPSEGYVLEISDSKISIKTSDASGAFYAIQTLRQLLPPEFEKSLVPNRGNKSLTVPQLTITDFPKFQYATLDRPLNANENNSFSTLRDWQCISLQTPCQKNV